MFGLSDLALGVLIGSGVTLVLVGGTYYAYDRWGEKSIATRAQLAELAELKKAISAAEAATETSSKKKKK